MPRTADAVEIERFSALAEQWWDTDGPMGALHALNPVRLSYLRGRLCAHFGLDPASRRPLTGLRVLEIGCGAGILCEPLARLGAAVTGIDASAEMIAAANAHAAGEELAIDYRAAAAEDLGGTWDAVLAMEVVEHVADVDGFVAAAAALVRPGGVFFAASLNRTARAFALGIVAAEWVLGWLPRGTHDWRRFVKPSELARPLRRAGLTVEDVAGVSYDASTATWRQSTDASVNYLLAAVRRPPAV